MEHISIKSRRMLEDIVWYCFLLVTHLKMAALIKDN